MDFKTWYEEADIPTQDKNGKWYDAETGLSFADWNKPHIPPRLDCRKSKHAEDIKAAREAARDAGWPDLTGTTKQKWWAVRIRRNLIATLPEALRDTAAFMNSSASWWIDQKVMRETIEKSVRSSGTSDFDKARRRDLIDMIPGCLGNSGKESFLEQVEEYADILRRRAEAVRRFDLAKAAEYEAREAAKLDGFAKVADEQRITFQSHVLELAPFSGNPVGEKIGDFVDGDARVRVFHNHSTKMLLFMANAPTGRMAFTIGA